ncbi:bacillithiol biosynthesis deacetylase BshB1 [Hazenella coriacea]|uniref:Bacillithiol biosynthesis deacetylase BshB1 n=1 Tax=Hazenella coriacea TaxID=1179467 RepID=A0A4R3L798_9BACL|nr:bacillithiol biosynthesis deacetylase BshB1 [Hazenella coriacea]TCS93366.1 bacillithiol biosynthesis deacetylase BshB1 [Hazenella coriacea]
MSIDLLAFGAHPDDVEIGMGGILAKHARAGFTTAICNLTEAELSSNGTVQSRRVETQRAIDILGVTEHINLGFPDRGLVGTPEQLLRITQVIRQWKPTIVLAPFWDDRHPDHVACSHLVKEAVFDAAIRKKETPGHEPVHRVSQMFHYFINDIHVPDVIVDISDVYETKVNALLAFESQFKREVGEVDTPLNSPTFLSMIRGRDQLWGHQIGVSYGEALASPRPLKQSFLISRS